MPSVAAPLRPKNTAVVSGVSATSKGHKQRILVYVVDWEGEVQTSTIFYSQGDGTLPMKQGPNKELTWTPGKTWDKDMRVTMEYQYAPADGDELSWIQGEWDQPKFVEQPAQPVSDKVKKTDTIPTKSDGGNVNYHVTMTVVQTPP